MISVITITYNNFEELKRTMSSLEGIEGIECIVVNGGDCEHTRKFLQEKSILSISEKDKGIADAFNKGFRLSHGNAILYLNSGDILLDKNYFKQAAQLIQSSPDIDFVHADIRYIDAYVGPMHVRPPGKLPQMPYLHPTMIVRREAFELVGPFDVSLKTSMDLDFAYRMNKLKLKGTYIPLMVVEMNGEGVSASRPGLVFRENLRVVVQNYDSTLRTWVVLLKLFLFLVIKKIIILMKADFLIKSYRKIRYSRGIHESK